jgi:hypothetical protein
MFKKNILKSDKLNICKGGEFKISLSMKDIDKIDKEIKNIENNSKKILDESDMIKSAKAELTDEGKSYNGIILLNTCVTCKNKFKPTNSMTNEILCNTCSTRK